MITNCFKCDDLCVNRRHIVNPSGDFTNCKLMFIGEAPGSTEDRLGLPFVGKAGKLLDRMFKHFNIDRSKGIIINNTIKCQPPGNRTPYIREINNCFPYLMAEVKLYNPKVIIGLGNTALKTITGEENAMISRYRGKYIINNDIVYFFTYHPAYILKNEDNHKIFNEFYNDFKFISKLYKLLM